MSRSLTVAALLLPLAAPLAAQHWVDDPAAERLAWGPATVVVRSDTLRGVQLWAMTSRTVRDTVPRRSFSAGFDPDSVLAWLDYARQLAGRTPPAPDPGATHLRTPPLRSTGGSQLFLDRARGKGDWAPEVQLFLVGPELRNPWYIVVPIHETGRLLATLFRRAGASQYQPTLFSQTAEPSLLDSTTAARVLTPVRLEYPAVHSRAGIPGEVWLTFVIRPDSTADPESYEVLFSDSPEFTRAAVRALDRARFQPLELRGERVAGRVFQRVTFLVRR